MSEWFTVSSVQTDLFIQAVAAVPGLEASVLADLSLAQVVLGWLCAEQVVFPLQLLMARDALVRVRDVAQEVGCPEMAEVMHMGYEEICCALASLA